MLKQSEKNIKMHGMKLTNYTLGHRVVLLVPMQRRHNLAPICNQRKKFFAQKRKQRA